MYLGLFKTIDAAKQAYDNAVIEVRTI
jgi:hypothetical protein